MTHSTVNSNQVIPLSSIHSNDHDLETDCLVNVHQQRIGSSQIATSSSRFTNNIAISTCRNEDIGPVLNPYEEYKYESKRLATFYDWPSNATQEKEDLASDGFIYLHIADRTQCVFCRVILSHWAVEDIVQNEHKTRCPECMFAHGLSTCGNVPIINLVSQQQMSSGNFSNPVYNNFMSDHGMSDIINENPANELWSEKNIGASKEPKYKEWAEERTRIKSFVGWPPNMTQKPIQLARAGLLYMGKGDRCKCFWCGGELYSWNPEDEPWEEHAKWFENCGYVRGMMGANFIQLVKNKQNGLIGVTNEQFMQHPHVLEVLRSDYTKDEVWEVFNKYGYMHLSTSQAIIHSIEEMRKAHLEDLNNKNRSVSSTQEGFSINNVHQPDENINLHAKEHDKHIPKTQIGQEAGSASGTNQIGEKEIDKVTEEFEKLRNMKFCKICKEKELCITFFPCGHFATCVECAQALLECPICGKPIKQKHKIYWS